MTQHVIEMALREKMVCGKGAFGNVDRIIKAKTLRRNTKGETVPTVWYSMEDEKCGFEGAHSL